MVPREDWQIEHFGAFLGGVRKSKGPQSGFPRKKFEKLTSLPKKCTLFLKSSHRLGYAQNRGPKPDFCTKDFLRGVWARYQSKNENEMGRFSDFLFCEI